LEKNENITWNTTANKCCKVFILYCTDSRKNKKHQNTANGINPLMRTLISTNYPKNFNGKEEIINPYDLKILKIKTSWKSDL